MTNVPEIRFNGFTDAWGQCKLGEVVEKLKSYSLSRDVETKEATGYRYIHYGDIHKQVADIVTRDEQLPNIKVGNYIPITQDDLVLADASEDYTGIAEPCVVLHTPKDKIIAGLHTIAIRPINTSPLFLYNLFHTDGFKKFGAHVGTGLKVFGITFTNLSQYDLNTPSLPEQTSIGSFFNMLDKCIAINQRKYDSLKKLKAAYLQQMFPQAGEKVPRVRFEGFTGDWNEVKLGEVAELSSSKRIHVSDYVSAGVPFYRGSEVSMGGVSQNNDLFISKKLYDDIKEHYGVPMKGDLLITAVGTLGNIWKVDNRQFYYKDGNLIRLSSLGVEADFLIAYLMDGQGKKKILDSAAGSSQKALTMVKLNEVEFFAPTMPEQVAIGNFFRNLDVQIETQSEKMEKLKQLKTAYLQKMFI